MKVQGSKSRRGFKKALAIIGALSVGATLLVSVLEINTASAATVHQGCKSIKPPQFFDEAPYGPTAHYYKVYKPDVDGQPDTKNALVCSKRDITAVGGDLSKSPNAPDSPPAAAPAGGTPAPAGGKVHAGCGKTVEPWFFDNNAHWYSETPKSDYSNAHLCEQADIDAAGGNPLKSNNGSGVPIGPVGTGPSPNGSDTVTDRQQGGSRSNPWPADPSLKPYPNGCKFAPIAGTTIRVWKYLGESGQKAGWYQCACTQFQNPGEIDKSQCTNAAVVPDDAEKGTNDDAKYVQRVAFDAWTWAKGNNVSIRKGTYGAACPAGYTVKDSDRVALPVDAAHPYNGWSAPNNGNWCNLVNWPIFLAGAQNVGKANIDAEMTKFRATK